MCGVPRGTITSSPAAPPRLAITRTHSSPSRTYQASSSSLWMCSGSDVRAADRTRRRVCPLDDHERSGRDSDAATVPALLKIADRDPPPADLSNLAVRNAELRRLFVKPTVRITDEDSPGAFAVYLAGSARRQRAPSGPRARRGARPSVRLPARRRRARRGRARRPLLPVGRRHRPPMRLATWNVNSLNVRLPRVLELLELHSPDVAVHAGDEDRAGRVPRRSSSSAAGYQTVHHSAGRWAGVAIARAPTAASSATSAPGLRGRAGGRRGALARGDRRRRARRLRVYVPNGRAVDSPFYEDKLRFLDARPRGSARCRRRAAAWSPATSTSARTDLDVYDPAAFVGDTHVTRREREALRRAARGRHSSTPSARSTPTSPASPGGTTARATSIARWACGSTRCCSSPPLAGRARRRAGSIATSARARSRRITRRCSQT